MKKMLLKHAFYIIAMLFSTAMLAQVTVTGVVSDKMGPLPGVNVLEKGTQNGTVTGFDGDYNLTVAEDATLVFSYIGFKTQEVAVDGQTTIDIKLEEDAAKLDEVIVVGYGSTTKKDRTGSVETVSAEDFNKGVQTNATDLLQGRTAGVQVTTSGGEPGGAANIRIRGGASLRAGNNPLYVVDGMLINSEDSSAGTGDFGLGTTSNKNPLNFINPSDIESISVLKDASATAIYGSRGANGVIIITTKKGKFGEPKITYSGTFGVSEVANEVDVLSAGGFRNAIQTEGITGFVDRGADVDAFNAITRTAQTANHNLTILGGGEKSKYRYSLSALDQEGVVNKSQIQNYTASLSNSYRFLEDDRLKVDVNLIASYVKDKRAPITNNAGFQGNLIGAALFWNPTVPLFNDDGTYRQNGSAPSDDLGPALSFNPLALSEYTNIEEETSRIVGNISATFEIIDGLDYKLNFGVDRSESNNRTSISRNYDLQGIWERGRAVNANKILYTQLIEHTLNYNKEINEDFKIQVLAGYGFQQTSSRGYSAIGENISLDPGNENDFLNGFNERVIESFKAPTADLESYFGRAIFDAYGKYTLTATFRADGSNKFGDNNEWGYFPAFAAAWKINEENFAPDFFDQLKLRASWGQSGNQNFPAGAADDRFVIRNDGQGNTIAQQETAANPDLQWEVNETINIGVDFAVLDNKLSGSIDVFQRDTDKLLFLFDPIQPAPPGTRRWENIDGTVQNQGLELTLFGDVVNTEDWSFTLGGNISFLKNELQDFTGAPMDIGPIFGQGLTSAVSQRIDDGEPINSFYMPVYAGLNADGNPTYLTADGGTTTNASTEADKRFVGDPNPNILVGLNANVRYKNWDMAVNMNGAYGHEIYNNTANVLAKNNLTARNILSDLVGNGENPDAANAVSTRFLESGDFIRLSNLTVGYNFDADLLPQYIKNLRIYATGQNLFVITPYSGFDPEVNTSNTFNGVPSFGIDYLSYPRARTYTLGINVSF
ncbi:SusC/RagA family TonB-linked outer membrane protein [Psychroflexus sp. MBR-150]|jgi:iron complex outermembrane receptor protein